MPQNPSQFPSGHVPGRRLRTLRHRGPGADIGDGGYRGQTKNSLAGAESARADGMPKVEAESEPHFNAHCGCLTEVLGTGFVGLGNGRGIWALENLRRMRWF